MEEINVWEHPPSSGIVPNEERSKKFFEENQTDSLLQPVFKVTQHEMMAEAKYDVWSVTGDFIYRHHVQPRVKLYVPREEAFPFPLKYIDVTRTTCTSLDVLLEKNTEDYWNVDGERVLSDAWTGFTRFVPLQERPPEGYTWSGRTLTRKHTTSRPDDVWPERWKFMSDAANKERKTKMGYRETKARQYQTIERKFLHWTKRWSIQAHNESRSQKVGSSDACRNSLQNTDKEQWRNPPQYWETHDEYACVVDADESTRPRLEGAGHEPHQDHVTAKGTNSITHYSLVF